MWFSKLFRRKKKPKESEEKDPQKAKANEEADKDKAVINQGVYYLYLIMGVQLAIVLGLLAVITAFGSFIATPVWVFFAALLLGGGGIVYLYRKIKQKVRKFKESFQGSDLSDRNYEISLMGGMFTMRVEQSPQRPMLEAPSSREDTGTPVLEAETVDMPSSSKASPEASPR